MVAHTGRLGLVGMHPLAPISPSEKYLAANGLQLAPLVALLGHVGLVGLRRSAPREPPQSSWQPPDCRRHRWWRTPLT